MSAKKARSQGDVLWCLPGKKRPFAYSTVATSDLIVLLAEEDLTVSDTQKLINYDQDAVNILQVFIDNDLGEAKLNTLVPYLGFYGFMLDNR